MVTDADRERVHEVRAEMLVDARTQDRVDVAYVEDVDAGGVPARVYVPEGAERTICFLHGGGFVYGEPDTHDAFTRRLASDTGSAVVFPDYRRAPDAPFPAAYDDSLAAWDWVIASDLPGPRVLLGDSAGANLALGAALARTGSADALVLVYPFLDPSGQTYDARRDNPDLGLEAMAWFWSMYATPDQWADLRLDPLLATTFAGLPRTLIQLASDDVLCSTGALLAERLRADGVDVTVTTYEGVPHGFWRQAAYPQSFQAVAEIADFLR